MAANPWDALDSVVAAQRSAPSPWDALDNASAVGAPPAVSGAPDAELQQAEDERVKAERAKLVPDLVGNMHRNVSPAGDLVRNLIRGTPVGSYLDEGIAGVSSLANKVTGGAVGSPYEESLIHQRAINHALDEDYGGLGTATKIYGGLAVGAPLAKSVMQGGNFLTRAVKGGGLGGIYSYIYGTGEGEGDLASRHEKGMEAVPMGVAMGTVLPPAAEGGLWALGKVRDWTAPTVARLGAWAADLPPATLRRIGLTMSADGAEPMTPGAQAAAEQMIADQLARAGTTVPQLEQQLQQAERSSLYSGGGQRGAPGASYAQNALAPVDLDPSLQRLAGAASRSAPEAANIAGKFQSARQTGLTPAAGDLPLGMGLPTRPMLAAEGEQPMGQFERFRDMLKRAFLISDEDFHGHGANAYRTDQHILEQAKAEAQPAYKAVYSAGKNVNIAPEVDSVFQQWQPFNPAQSQKMALEALPVQQTVAKVAKLFMPQGKLVSDIEQFDKTKQYVDSIISNYFKPTASQQNQRIGGILNEFKNDMLAAVDGITANKLGAQYANARGLYSSRMEARRALQAGQDAWKEGSNVGVDTYGELAQTPGMQKLFRLGYLGGFEQAAGRMKRTADVSQLFATPERQTLLRAIIPRTQTPGGRIKMENGAPAAFSDRPERVGQFIGNEQRMIATRDATLGNSKTAERIADDEAFQVLSHAADRLKEGASVSDSASLTGLVLKWVPGMLNKVFGMRQDTAAAIARQLFTADPARRAQVLQAVAARMGNNRYERFKQLLGDHYAELVRAASIQNAQSNPSSP